MNICKTQRMSVYAAFILYSLLGSPAFSQNDSAATCNARVALAVNGQVVSRSLTYGEDSGQNPEDFDTVTASVLTSSLLTQYFLASPITLFEPGQLEREIIRQQKPQTPEQFETIIATDEADFIVSVSVSVSTQPFRLENGSELFDSQANVFLTAFKSASGGEIIAEERFQGRSRLDHPSAELASQTAVEKALQGLNVGPGAKEPWLITRICRAYGSLTSSSGRASLRIDIDQLSSFEQVAAINSTLEATIPDLAVANYTFNRTKARFSVTVPTGTSIDTIALGLLEAASKDEAFPELEVLERQDSFLHLEVKY